jgi:hypothetical protein
MIWYLPVYIFLCLFVSYYGKQTRLGFWGLLLVSVFFTPWLVGVGLVLFAPVSSSLISPFRMSKDKKLT